MEMISHTTRNRLLNIPLVLAMAAVSIAGLLDLNTSSEKLKALILLVAFATILFTQSLWHNRVILVHICLAVLSALAAALLTMPQGWNFFPILFFLLAPLAMIHLPAKAGLVWIGLFTLITGVVFVSVNGPTGLAFLLPFAAGYVFFGIFGWMTVEADHNRVRTEALLAELQTAHQQLQAYTARVEELAIIQERNRIAGEVHDSLGHRLTVAAVQLEGAQRLVRANPERAEKIIAMVRDQVREGLAELRRTVAILRASVDEDLPLSAALTRLASQFEDATGLPIHLNLEACPEDLPAVYRQAFFQAAQEGLTNIQRHAKATEAWLNLNPGGGQISLLISDNGAGIPVPPDAAPGGHFGLAGLKERAALLGGEFYVDPRPGGGTQLTFRLPTTAEIPHE